MSKLTATDETRTACPRCGQEYVKEVVHQCQEQTADQPAPPTLPAPPPGSKRKPEPETPPAAADPLIGATIGDRYRILELVGQGAMGAVYKARHLVLHNLIAIKVLLITQSEELHRRFLHEAQLASKIHHPNTVYIADYGLLPDGRPFLAMEYLEGETLGRLIQSGRLDVVRTCQIGLQIARGMHEIHEKGIIHRDLKPDNILLVKQAAQGDFVKILDFGIAKMVGTTSPTSPLDSGGTLSADSTLVDAAQLTRSGALVGTPTYMAPEQVLGSSLDARADQYSFGVIIYKMLAGKPPFLGATVQETMAMRVGTHARSLREECPEQNIPEELDRLVARCLHPEREGRYPDMTAVVLELEQLLELIRPRISSRSLEILQTGTPSKIDPPAGWRRLSRPIYMGAALAILLLGLGVWFVAGRLGSSGQISVQMLKQARQEAIGVLKELAGDRGPEIRVTALSALGDTHDLALTPTILRGTEDPSPDVQAQAAVALAQLGAAESQPVLRRLLTRGSGVRVRLGAARALAQLGDEDGIRFLQESLGDKDPEVRMRAAFALCERANPLALSTLRQLLSGDRADDALRLDMLACLAGNEDENALQQLHQQLGSGVAPLQRIAAATRLVRLEDAQALALLRALVRRSTPEQLIAARSLASPDEPGTAELFRSILRSPGAELPSRQLAMDGLGASGQDRDLELLRPFLSSDQEIQLRLASAAAVVRIVGRDPRLLSAHAIAWAQRTIGDQDWTVRSSVAGVLGDIRSPESVPLLSGMLKDSKAEVRRQAIKSLGRHFEFAAALALRDGLRDQDAEVRRDTLRALGRIGQSLVRQAPAEANQIREWLYRLFDQAASAHAPVPADELVIARGALLRIGDGRQLAPLRGMVNETSAPLRELALEQLAEDAQGLLSFLKDAIFSVRFSAARLLAQRGDRRALPILSEGLARGGEPALVAFGLLKQLGQRVNLTADMAALLRSGKDAERLQIIRACDYLPPTDVIRLLRIALRDTVFAIRWRSVEVIAERQAALGAAGSALLRQLSADPSPALRARADALLSRAAPPLSSAPALAAGATADSSPAQPPEDGAAALNGPDLGADKTSDSPTTPGNQTTPDAPSGRGTLIVTARYSAQYQIDHLAWQAADGKPMLIDAGPHTLTTLGGDRPVSIVENQTTTVQLEESKAEQFERVGRAELEHGDPRKAQKLLEKARASCARGLRNSSACNALSFDVSVYLGQCFDAQERWSEAMLEYQRALQIGGVVQGKASLKEQAQRAILKLEPRLGKVILLKRAHGKRGCAEDVQWLPPGTHSVTVAGKEQTVVVRVRETVRVGECE